MSRRDLAAFFAAVAALAVPAVALAATPQQIVADAADGHLSAHYSQSDLRRALKNATVQGYGNPIIKITLNNKATGGNATANASSSGCCRVGHPQVFTPPHTARQNRTQVQSSATLPFTGSNLATYVCLGIMLISGGLLLRLFAGGSSSRERSRI